MKVEEFVKFAGVNHVVVKDGEELISFTLNEKYEVGILTGKDYYLDCEIDWWDRNGESAEKIEELREISAESREYFLNLISETKENIIDQRKELLNSKNLTRDDIKSLVFSEDDKIEEVLRGKVVLNDLDMQELRDMQHDIIYDLEPTELEHTLKTRGWVELREGVFLNSQESILAEQKEWDDSDKAKNFDFTESPYWLTTDSGGGPVGIEDLSKIEFYKTFFQSFFG